MFYLASSMKVDSNMDLACLTNRDDSLVKLEAFRPKAHDAIVSMLNFPQRPCNSISESVFEVQGFVKNIVGCVK